MVPGAFRGSDDTLDGLRDALRTEFDVVELENDWDGIQEAVEEEEPVIVTIANPSPLAELSGGHAVVIFQMRRLNDFSERVVYLDPESGTHESKPLAEFLQWWDVPGQRGFLLRP